MTDSDAKLRTLVGYNIKRANAATKGEVERVLGRHGLRRTTYSVLSVIAGNAGIRQSELASALAIERSNLVQLLDELERSSLISRTRDITDRRAYLLRVTDAGAARLEAAKVTVEAYDVALTDGLSAAEKDALITALRRVEENGRKFADRGLEEAWEGLNAGDVSTA